MRPELTDEELYESERRRAGTRPVDRPTGPADSFMSPLGDDFLYGQPPAGMDQAEYRGEQEYLCDRCGAELPPRARFCAACGHSIEPTGLARTFGRVETKLNRWFAPDGVLARRFGLTPASIVALGVASFCLIFALAVQLTIPERSPSYSPAELYQVYSVRTLLWLVGAIVALVAAIVFKRDPGAY